MLACIGLLGAWFLTSKPKRVHIDEVGIASAEAPRAAPAHGRAVFVMDRRDAGPSLSPPQKQTPLVPTAAPAPPPFAFLGKIEEDGESVVLLYRSGRTLKVRGAGLVADGYVVDALLENHLLLRHVPSGTQQLIEFAARDTDPPVSYSPDEAPQD